MTIWRVCLVSRPNLYITVPPYIAFRVLEVCAIRETATEYLRKTQYNSITDGLRDISYPV